MAKVIMVRLLNRQGLSEPLAVSCDSTADTTSSQLVLVGWPDSEALRIGVEQRNETKNKTLPETAPFVVTRLTWPEKKLRLMILKGQRKLRSDA